MANGPSPLNVMQIGHCVVLMRFRETKRRRDLGGSGEERRGEEGGGSWKLPGRFTVNKTSQVCPRWPKSSKSNGNNYYLKLYPPSPFILL